MDEAALTAALIAAGIDPRLAALLTAYYQVAKHARLRLVYGVLLAPAAALRLRENVASVKEQTVKKLITPDTAHQALLNLGVPELNATPLVAAWAAAVKTVWPPAPA